jgi:hexosaminidase
MARETGPSVHRPKLSKFRGIALTGWSRYDHFAVLCELLPVALPSLLLNLNTVSSNGSEVSKFRQTEKLLKCSTDDRNYDRLSPVSLEQDPHQFELRRCKFPGAKIFGAVGSLVRYKAEVEALDTSSRETQVMISRYY